jgi:hypothetical protein
VEWLLASIFTHFPEDKGSVAAVCFNVKGPDLLFLDKPGKLDEADKAIYEKLGVPAKPFEKVSYFAPYTAQGFSINTLRSNEALSHNLSPLTWGLNEVMQFAEVLLNRDDVDAKADAFIDFLTDRIVGKEFEDKELRGRPFRVVEFAERQLGALITGQRGLKAVLAVIDVSGVDLQASQPPVIPQLLENRASLGGSLQCVVVLTEALQRRAEKEMRLRETSVDLERLAEHRDRAVHVAFLNARARRSPTHPHTRAPSASL